MICVLLFGKRILLSNVMNKLGKLHSSYLKILPSCGSTGKPLINAPESAGSSDFREVRFAFFVQIHGDYLDFHKSDISEGGRAFAPGGPNLGGQIRVGND